MRIGSRPAAATRVGTGSGSRALPGRPGAPDLRSHRASQPDQEAAPHSHLRRGATAAACRPRTAPAAAQLRYGFGTLPDLAAGRAAPAAPHPVAADARTFAPA